MVFISLIKNMKLLKIKILLLLILFISFNIFSLNASSFFDYPISTVFLDAGHGGEDSGAIASYSFNPLIKEKDIVLDISLSVEKYLNEELPDISVIQTRYDDTFISLQNRGELAYKQVLGDKNSSIYISIHANSANNNNASGFEIFTKLENKSVNIFDEETPIENIPLFVSDNLITLNQKQYNSSLTLASDISTAIKDDILEIQNRGIKSDDLYVLNVCRTTGCLVEVGFLSNEDEAKKLLDPSYRNQIAKAITDGIVEYIKNRRS